MYSGSPELHQKSLQIKQGDKFFSRLLSRESSMANPSLRVYYGGEPGAIPFLWESRPGTPKHTFCDSTLPPLTPPPSYYSNSNKNPIKKHSRSSLLHALFSKTSLKKINLLPLPSSFSSSRSSSISDSSISGSSMFAPISTPTRYHGRSRSSSFNSRGGDDQDDTLCSPTSTLCFGIGRVTLSSKVGNGSSFFYHFLASRQEFHQELQFSLCYKSCN
ncbi:hypothetical protein RGQ29_025413 [Quercus rubra]|uniref:Uncharacterized protein n=1 Tax=Quercus rubra TaxID=3512 RepID=A0AAN7EXT8_QUERU|nr:hypothetical protein RGQ29_025413 [Quercus rubra]